MRKSTKRTTVFCSTPSLATKVPHLVGSSVDYSSTNMHSSEDFAVLFGIYFLGLFYKVHTE